jgi:hypothetical protein
LPQLLHGLCSQRDGSWFVPTRALPIPLFDADFPMNPTHLAPLRRRIGATTALTMAQEQPKTGTLVEWRITEGFFTLQPLPLAGAMGRASSEESGRDSNFTVNSLDRTAPLRADSHGPH